MRKKLLLVSLLVLTLLLLMPSIPAIQQNVVKEDIKDKVLNELSEDLDFKDIKELVDSGKLDDIKHPLLFKFVRLVITLQAYRFGFYAEASIFFTESDPWGLRITHPILFFFCMFRAAQIFLVVIYWLNFWAYISDKMGWNWDISPWP